MKSNVFKDFPFVKTNKGPMTVEEFFIPVMKNLSI